MDLDFKGTSNDTETQYRQITELLKNNICVVEFTKLDGELRTMPCTLRQDILPVVESKQDAKIKEPDLETISVWCTDKQAWRSFKTMRVTTVKVKND